MLRNDYIRVHPVMMQSIPALLEIWTPKLVRGPDIDSVTRQPSPEGAMFNTIDNDDQCTSNVSLTTYAYADVAILARFRDMDFEEEEEFEEYFNVNQSQLLSCIRTASSLLPHVVWLGTLTYNIIIDVHRPLSLLQPRSSRC